MQNQKVIDAIFRAGESDAGKSCRRRCAQQMLGTSPSMTVGIGRGMGPGQPPLRWLPG